MKKRAEELSKTVENYNKIVFSQRKAAIFTHELRVFITVHSKDVQYPPNKIHACIKEKKKEHGLTCDKGVIGI